MDQNELETFQVQLSQVELALKDDPENTELKDLASELKQIIDLTQSAISQSQAQNKPETSRKTTQTAVAGANGKTWTAGDECLAKYSGDGHWYPARITHVGGAADNRVFSIVFKGYNTTELVKANELKPPTATHLSGPGPYGGASGGAAGKRKLTKEDEDERERKKKKNEKKLELRAAKAKEQNEKKASWQKFAKKSERKGIHIAGVAGTSIFKTPDNPHGKVGVTGSGKGMTENQSRPKNKFVVDSNTTS